MRPLHHRIRRNLENPSRLIDWATYQLSRQNDTHFVSLPSSGTHWLRFMFAKGLVEAYDLEYEFTGIRPHGLVPTFRAKNQRFRYNNREEIPRIQHSHKAYSPIYFRSRVLVLIRDLRDTMVSSYDTYSAHIDPEIDFSSFLRGVGVDESRHRTLQHRIQFLNSWHENRKRLSDRLVVKYEDLKADTHDIVRQALEFAGIEDISDDLVETVVEFGSIENMRRLESPEEFQDTGESAETPEADPEDASANDGRKVNEGSTERWTEYFSDDDISYFRSYVDEHLIHDYGYDY